MLRPACTTTTPTLHAAADETQHAASQAAAGGAASTAYARGRLAPHPAHTIHSARAASPTPAHPHAPTCHGVGPGLRGPTALPPTTSHFGATGQARAGWRLPDAAAGGVATIGSGASLIDASGPAECGFGHEHRYQGEVI